MLIIAGGYADCCTPRLVFAVPERRAVSRPERLFPRNNYTRGYEGAAKLRCFVEHATLSSGNCLAKRVAGIVTQVKDVCPC